MLNRHKNAMADDLEQTYQRVEDKMNALIDEKLNFCFVQKTKEITDSFQESEKAKEESLQRQRTKIREVKNTMEDFQTEIRDQRKHVERTQEELTGMSLRMDILVQSKLPEMLAMIDKNRKSIREFLEETV